MASKISTRDLMAKLTAAESATRDLFPWPPGSRGAVRRRGDQDSLSSLWDFFGLFFEEERRGQRVYTSLHTLVGKSAASRELSRESVAASAVTSGVCNNRACPSRNVEEVKGLSLCSRCRFVAYCGIACQRDDWPAHKAACKRSAAPPSEPAPTGDAMTISAGSTAFSSAATAAVVAASGPIAMLAWIWRSKTGYKGEIPARGILPPVVLVELAESEGAGWKPPVAMRVSELLDPLGCESIPALLELQFPRMFVMQVMDAAAGSLGAQIRSGERVMCVVTTPARDPRRTKILSLVHCVPLPLLARKLKAIERAEAGSGVGEMYATPVLEALAIVARPVFGDEEALLFGHRAEEDRVSDAKVDRTFCNLQAALDYAGGPPARVHALLVSDCELTSR